MESYKIQSIVRNGQIIVDLPTHFNETDAVEITVSKVVAIPTPNKPSRQTVEKLALNPNHENGILPPRQKIDLTTLRGAFKTKMSVEEIDSLTKSWRDEWKQDFS